MIVTILLPLKLGAWTNTFKVGGTDGRILREDSWVYHSGLPTPHDHSIYLAVNLTRSQTNSLARPAHTRPSLFENVHFTHIDYIYDNLLTGAPIITVHRIRLSMLFLLIFKEMIVGSLKRR
jgi:hypothetical protein